MSFLRVHIFLALLCLLAACSSSSNNTAFMAKAPDNVAASTEYLLSPGDLLDISVFQVPDLTKEVQIDAAGEISLPLIGDIKAGGQTAHSLEAEIATKLQAKYLQSPQVSVFVKNAAGQQVTVTGAVNKPGVYPVVGRTTLVQVLAQSGDLSEIGDHGSIRVLRQVNGSQTQAKFNIDDIRAGKAADPDLYAGDMVVVDDSGVGVAWKNTKDILAPATGVAGTGALFLLH
jgi:polysaccharide export outer membrane protein